MDPRLRPFILLGTLALALACAGFGTGGNALDLGCGHEVDPSAFLSSNNKDIPEYWSEVENLDERALQAVICDPSSPSLKASIALERLATAKINSGEAAEGVQLMIAAADDFVNPTAMVRLAALYQRGDSSRGTNIRANPTFAFVYHHGASRIVDHVGNTYGRPAASTYVTPVSGIAMIMSTGPRGSLALPEHDRDFATRWIEALVKRYQMLYST
ncbi:MAG: hypothetical protein EA397_14905 [Deltaproteobacteria bacterium]|nr:MAG: hypothetical protein EA397_14905 [Deltaproteobacteria bacterium]